ncbi:hypothetical protein AB7M15_006355 [Bradyrhizobium ottawaense]
MVRSLGQDGSDGKAYFKRPRARKRTSLSVSPVRSVRPRGVGLSREKKPVTTKKKPARKCSPKERDRFRRWRRGEGRKYWVYASNALLADALRRGLLSEADATDPDRVAARLEAMLADWSKLRDCWDAHHPK